MAEIHGLDLQQMRERVRAWLRFYEKRFRRRIDLAERLGMREPTITNIINGKRTPGLDVVARMHWRLHIEADKLLDHDPPEATPPSYESAEPVRATVQEPPTKYRRQPRRK